jgi:hypothetical protein
MHARGLISNLSMAEVPMHDRAGHDHSSDKAYALCYRKNERIMRPKGWADVHRSISRRLLQSRLPP